MASANWLANSSSKASRNGVAAVEIVQGWINRLKPKLVEFDYFFSHPSQNERREQSGVFRTNCMDCLDRTNVVLSRLTYRDEYEWFQLRHVTEDLLIGQTAKKGLCIALLEFREESDDPQIRPEIE